MSRICKLVFIFSVLSTTSAEPETDYCPDPEPPEHGRISPKKAWHRHGDNVDLTCIEGFTSTVKILTCNNGQWRPPVYRCIHDCRKVPRVKNAHFVWLRQQTMHRTTSRGQSYYVRVMEGEYKCLAGFEKLDVADGPQVATCSQETGWLLENTPTCSRRCRDIQVTSVPHGYVTLDGLDNGSSATYVCEAGYLLQGIRKRTCFDGEWSGIPPSCIKISDGSCEAPDSPAHGLVELYEDFALYTCEAKWVLDGPERQYCDLWNFKWRGQQPVCIPVDCGPPPLGPNTILAVARGTKWDVGTLVLYSCPYGYYPVDGRAPVHNLCEEGYVWTYRSNAGCVCKSESSCCLPLAPENGGISTQGQFPGENITFFCIEGYGLKGPKSLLCQDDLTWDAEPPVCVENMCEPPDFPFGSVEYSTLNVGDTILFTCKPGYALVGYKELTCVGRNRWNEFVPVCFLVTCAPPKTPENGKVYVRTRFPFLASSTEAYFTCFTGYQLDGTELIKCQPDGSWSDEAPTCVNATCPELFVEHGAVVGDRHVGAQTFVNCLPGYKLTGTEALYCRENFTWSISPPECTPFVCDDPAAPVNGQVFYNKTSPGSKATFLCDRGYHLAGEKVAVCSISGTWSSPEPVCRETVCPGLSDVRKGYITGDIKETYPVGAFVLYRCFAGYKLNGAGLRMCLEDGQWSSFEPRCELVHCGEPAHIIDNGVLVSSHVHEKISAIVQCNDGYKPIPDVCRHISVSRMRECKDIGYDMSITCESSGQWSGTLGYCERVCPTPYIPSNIQNISDFTYWFAGEQLDVVCGSSDKNVKLECGANGEWIGDEMIICE